MTVWTLKERLASGETTIGSWLSFGSPLLAEMMAKSGFDWLVIDMEHGTSSVTELVHLCQVVGLCGVPPLVRVGENDPRLIKQAMDAGAAGIVVPMVNSVSDAEAARDSLYYPPVGTRGVGLTRAHAFGLGFDKYKDDSGKHSTLIVQIEHFEAVDALDQILAVEGVDGFIVGPYDMSGSIGKPGQFDDPDVKALLNRASEFVTTSEKPGGYHIVHSDHRMLKQRLAEGCRFLAYGTEMVFLAEKLRDEMEFVSSAKGG